MNWNKEVIKGPLPWWVIVICAILSGGFVSYMVNKDIKNDGHDAFRIIACFAIGASAYIYGWLMIRLFKNPTPWLRRNFGLLVTIGCLINAALILLSIFEKKMSQ